MLVKFAASLVIGAIAVAATADECRTSAFIKGHRNHAIQLNSHRSHDIYHHHQNYGVSDLLKLQATLTQAIRSDPDYGEFLKYKGYKDGYAQALQDLQRSPDRRGIEFREPVIVVDPPVPPKRVKPKTMIEADCYSCHGPQLTTPKDGVVLDVELGIPCETGVQALAAVEDGHMPKGKTYTEDQKKQFRTELYPLIRYK